eukprot:CAMPEP_0172639922 /NCGR_PEP_ID=MMETSP1068-20121228/220523_1 /TAXON_ID=35684 /ORGANISM="Pseudopedinella elastica, Strain CCMP716" /LENGTH=63 /DNA_ID=CAMNT_0013453175 /DNA_START=1086 /DNA_END=1273 /DNA_ORIENTATION=-
MPRTAGVIGYIPSYDAKLMISGLFASNISSFSGFFPSREVDRKPPWLDLASWERGGRRPLQRR